METIANEVQKPANKPRKYRKVMTSHINDIWSADIVDMQALQKQNEGYKYILTVIDIHSRYAWAFPLKSKTAKETAEAFETIIQQTKALPYALWVDQGKEFLNKEVKKIMKNVNIYSTFGETKAAYVERLNRTLKGMMYKQFTVQQNRRWLDILDDVVKKYNNKIHRSIRQKPSDIYKNGKKLSNEIEPLPTQNPKFKQGDRVRISYKRREVFDKAYYPNWTWEIFTVDQVNKTNPWTYKLKDYKGEIIEGSFYESELQKTQQKKDTYLVEAILKTKKVKGKKYVLVKWLGYPDSANTWEPETNVKDFNIMK